MKRMRTVCYDKLDSDRPLRQGDIFYPLPYVEAPLLDKMQILQKTSDTELKSFYSDWDHIQDGGKTAIAVGIRKVWGIVASQDCDASRAPNISLFEVEPYIHINPTPPTNAKRWTEALTERACKNASWMYLPINEEFGITDRMIINFDKVFQIPRVDLRKNIKLRKGRLTEVAYEHYRECIAQYYRRYPYNEWYPFNKDEASFYVSKGRCAIDELYPWQK